MTRPSDARMQDLLAQGDFVRSLARQLIGAADAEDLAQDAWLTALRRRPGVLREPRSWFARPASRARRAPGASCPACGEPAVVTAVHR